MGVVARASFSQKDGGAVVAHTSSIANIANSTFESNTASRVSLLGSFLVVAKTLSGLLSRFCHVSWWSARSANEHGLTLRCISIREHGLTLRHLMPPVPFHPRMHLTCSPSFTKGGALCLISGTAAATTANITNSMFQSNSATFSVSLAFFCRGLGCAACANFTLIKSLPSETQPHPFASSLYSWMFCLHSRRSPAPLSPLPPVKRVAQSTRKALRLSRSRTR